MSSALSVGTSILGALLGRKAIGVTNARRAGSSMRSVGRSSKEKGDIERAKENLDELMVKFEDLENEFNEALEECEKINIEELDFDDLEVTPRKSDISIEEFAVCWLPWHVSSSGIAEPIY